MIDSFYLHQGHIFFLSYRSTSDTYLEEDIVEVSVRTQ